MNSRSSRTSGADERTRNSRAVFFDAPRTVAVRDFETDPSEGDTAVTSRLIGISAGTEMLFYNGPFPSGTDAETLPALQGATDYPVKYGYSNVGVTAEGRRVFAFYPHQDRFFAPSESLIPLGDDISDDDAVFLPFMETALQIVHDAGPRFGERVAVFGLGVIGLLTAALLRRLSLEVIAIDPLPIRRERAKQLGCVPVEPAVRLHEPAVRLHEPAGRFVEQAGGPVDLAINTSASEVALQTALDVVADEGVVIEASWYGSRRISANLGGSFHRRRLSIRSSQVSNLNPAMSPRWDRQRRTRLVLRLLRELAPGRYITHRYSLEDADAAFTLISENRNDVLQVVLKP